MRVDGSSFHCEALIRVEPPVVARGGSFRVECEIRGGVADIYNAFLCEDYKLPAQIVITSADGKLRRELLHSDPASRKNSAETTWLQLSGTVGRELNLVISAPREGGRAPHPGVRTIDLPAGEYWVQAIYNNWLVAHWPNGPLKSFSARSTPLPGDEAEERGTRSMDGPILVSEPVKLTVTANQQLAARSEGSSKCPLRIDLRLDDASPVIGRDVKGEVRLVNRSDTILEVYNPFLDDTLQDLNRAIVLDFSTFDGRHIGNLLRVDHTSFKGLTPRHWVTIPPGGVTSRTFTFRAGQVPRTAFQVGSELPPGKYNLEARAFGQVVSGRPSGIVRAQLGVLSERARKSLQTAIADAERQDAADRAEGRITIEEWERTFPGPEICRSNRVELEILPRTGD